MSETPLGEAIKHAVFCVLCQAPHGTCACWSRCECGWLYEKAKGPEDCANPVHGRPPGPPRHVALSSGWKP